MILGTILGMDSFGIDRRSIESFETIMRDVEVLKNRENFKCFRRIKKTGAISGVLSAPRTRNLKKRRTGT